MKHSFNPADFYHQAHTWYGAEIAAAQHEEATLRSVISRAYYAAFLAARTDANIAFGNQDVHAVVMKHYKNQTRDKKKIAIGNRLESLRERRKDADYELEKNCVRRYASEALKESERILQDLGYIKVDDKKNEQVSGSGQPDSKRAPYENR